MTHRPRLPLCLAIAAAFCGLTPAASAKSERWTGSNGSTIEAEPADILGPWALFDNGTLLPLSLLSDEDCVRFYQGLKEVPARAADWKLATSKVSQELFGGLMRYSGNDLVPDDESGRPEPEFYIIFFTSPDSGDMTIPQSAVDGVVPVVGVTQATTMLGRSTPALYAKLEKNFPGMAQGVVFGVGETLQDHMNIAANSKGGWMFTKFDEEVQMRTIKTIIPTNLYGILVVTRAGIPLFGPNAATDDEVKATFDKFTGLLSHIRANDPKVWIAQAHYYRAVQPVAYSDGHCGPMLMGNPLLESVLRKMKIYRLDVTFTVSAEGKVAGVDVKPGNMSPATVAMFTQGFQNGGCLFVPAVDHGKFVDGTYVYHMEVSQ